MEVNTLLISDMAAQLRHCARRIRNTKLYAGTMQVAGMKQAMQCLKKKKSESGSGR